MSDATLIVESKSIEPVLYMALELSEKTWKVLFTSHGGERRERSVGCAIWMG